RTAYERILPAPLQEHYPLSHAQQRLWILQQMSEEQQAYNIPYHIQLKGVLHRGHFEAALAQLVARHEILRTVFITVDEEPAQQVISPEAFNFSLIYDDFSESADAEILAAEVADNETVFVFDLTTGPLIRARLVKTAEEHFLLCFTLHHIVFDGWSVQVLIEDLMKLYAAQLSGNTAALAPLAIQYKDFAWWQNNRLQGMETAMQQQYWNNRFAGELPVLELPLDYPRPKIRSYNGQRHISHIPATLVSQLTGYSQSEGISTFVLLVAAVNVLLYKYTGQQDIVVGTPVAGRESVGLSNQIGFYVNTLAIRNQIEAEKPFRDFLFSVKKTLLDAYQHQSYPFDKLVEDLRLSGDGTRSPLFDVMVVMQHKAAHDTFALSQLEMIPGNYTTATSKFDLVLHFSEEEDGWQLGIEYSTDLFQDERIKRMSIHLTQILNEIAADADQPVDNLQYLSREEETELLRFAGDHELVPADQSVPSVLSGIVGLHYESLALSDGKTAYTYGELWERSGLISGYLQQICHVQEESLVGIVMSRGTGFVLSMTGILRSGAAYLPIESHQPVERIRRLLQEGGVSVVLTDNDSMAS
ncbi:condensation domain-containing protein, partial [Chitinophaga sp. 30R24]|uniref:condensation domain-containing protein n=1 Tax=Chitinophaga sp. 30R24 TaxID=3248838 RepID=UPI003B9202D2